MTRLIDDVQADFDKKTGKKNKLEKDLIKDEHELEKAQNELKKINARLEEHQKKLKREVTDLIIVKDRALQ